LLIWWDLSVKDFNTFSVLALHPFIVLSSILRFVLVRDREFVTFEG
jgi:hypothetical protein